MAGPTKFIPNGDMDFRRMAESFARAIAAEPARFAVSDDDAAALSKVVARYAEAFQAARGGGTSRSRAHTMAKDQARADAERIVRRLANTIRANDRVDAQSRLLLGLRERAASPPKMRRIADGMVGPAGGEPPRLWFVRALHQGSQTPMHELKFRSLDYGKAKAAGAVRLELFVDLVPPEEPIPAFPGANLNSRPWYLRSYSRSPIVLVPPMARVPMRVVYWGRWADSSGGVGPFSKTVTAWIEGGSHHLMGPQLGKQFAPAPLMMPLLEDGGEARLDEQQVRCRLDRKSVV